MNSELFKQMNYLHRNHNPGAIVDGAGAQIPGIQMRRRNDDLLELRCPSNPQSSCSFPRGAASGELV